MNYFKDRNHGAVGQRLGMYPSANSSSSLKMFASKNELSGAERTSASVSILLGSEVAAELTVSSNMYSVLPVVVTKA
jgi:hypothetical protein